MSTQDPTSLSGLRICLAGINYAPDSTGIAPYTTAMAAALRKAGAAVHVVTGLPHYPEWKIKGCYSEGQRWDEEYDDVQLTRVRHHVPKTPHLIGRARMEFSFMTRAHAEIRRQNPDISIAITPSLSGLAAAAINKRGKPLGVIVQDLTGNASGQSGSSGKHISKFIGSAEYALLRRADLIGTITPHFSRVLTSNNISANKIVDVANFTHVKKSDSSRYSAREILCWPKDDYLVVHTGNMGMKQGLENVVAAAKFSEKESLGVTFILVGDGNQRSLLETMSIGCSTIKIVDPLNEDQYPLALAAADALLLHERRGVLEMSLPSKLTSYSIADRPIIAVVEPGGITQKVLAEDSSAAILMPGEPKELAQLAYSLSGNALLSNQLARRAGAMHQNRYTAEAAYRRYVAFAEGLASLL
jgi:colanic acid biosynthesis glycosyl transferase WcaI